MATPLPVVVSLITPFYTLEELCMLHIDGKLRCKKENFEVKNQITQQESREFRNVHRYDGQITYKSPSFSPSFKKELFEKFLCILENPKSKLMVDRIFGDPDPEPSDLLTDILSGKMSIDIFLLLEEQLADNFLLGQCKSGRVNRLVQIKNMLS